jgi:hypothetical protein
MPKDEVISFLHLSWQQQTTKFAKALKAIMVRAISQARATTCKMMIMSMHMAKKNGTGTIKTGCARCSGLYWLSPRSTRLAEMVFLQPHYVTWRR